jgi:uncharacterized protein involved in outer membrane biogenesis
MSHLASTGGELSTIPVSKRLSDLYGYHNPMHRWVRLGLIVIATILGLLLASGLVIRALVSGSLKDWFIASMEARTGTKVSIARADFDLLRWCILRPAVTLHDVAIANPPGFPAGNLLEAKKISARISLFPFFRRRVEVESMSVDQPRIIVTPDDRGHTNLEVFLRAASAHDSPKKPASTGNGGGSTPIPQPKKEALLKIDDMSVKSGTLSYSGTKEAYLTDVSLRLRGLCRDEPCQIQASAKLFSGRVSNVKVEGHVGPFNPESLPLDATMTMTLALAEAPADLRQERLGALLAAPGDKARAVVESSLKGDVYQSMTGPAKLVLTSIQVGNHPGHLMPLSGQAPGTVTATTLMTHPVFKIAIPDASLQLGKGQWKGNVDFEMQGKHVGGEVPGAIHDLEVNEFLSAFTNAREKIFGKLAMPSLKLTFAGANGPEIAASLTGTGRISVTEGRLSMLDFPATLRKVLGKSETEGAAGTTSFSSLTADLTIAGQKINVANLAMEGAGIRLTGSGVINFDHTIVFDTIAHVDTAKLVKIGPFHLPSVNVDVPLDIDGTVEKPKVHPKFGKPVKGAAIGILRKIKR